MNNITSLALADFYDARHAASFVLADAIRTACEDDAGAYVRCNNETLAGMIEILFVRGNIGAGLNEKAAAKARNVFNATMRRAIVSALDSICLTAKVSIKVDKLRPGACVATVLVADQDIAEKSVFTARRGLEAIQAQLAKLSALEGLNESESAALLKLAEDVILAAQAMDSRI